jgi:hypothetical protein
VDPDELLSRIREAMAEWRVADSRGQTEARADAAETVVHGLEDLDEWLMKGGYVPKAWEEAAKRTMTKVNRETLARAPKPV